MINKIVKIDEGLVQFLYPNFELKSSITFLDRDRDIIYNGRMKPNIKDYLFENTKSFISLTGPVEEDYTDKEKLLEFVYSKYDKTAPKTVLDQLDQISDDEFIYSIKYFWVAGSWPYSVIESDKTLFDLFQSTTKGSKEFLQTCFKVLEAYPFYMVESSYLTFLSRVVNVSDQQVSPQYSRLLKAVESKSGYKIPKAVLDYSRRKSYSELSFIKMIMEIR